MVFPNSECYNLCTWMLTVFVPRLTGAQITLTQTVQAAALAQTSVTDNEWKDFQRYAQWRNPYYIVYRDYQTAYPVDLTTGLVHYYPFEGNSNDSVGSINGTDTSITYSTSYGKIGQGARASTATSKIVLGAVSDFTYIQNTGVFAINFWFNPQVASGNYYVLSQGSGNSNKGLYLNIPLGGITRQWIMNGAGSTLYTYFSEARTAFSDLGYKMHTLTADGTMYYYYVNGVLSSRGLISTLSTGNASNPLNLLYWVGVTNSPQCYIDELGFWNRALNYAEIMTLYNSGAGITYPF